MIRIFSIDRKTKEEHEITDNLYYFEEQGYMSFQYSSDDYRIEISLAGETTNYWIENGEVTRANRTTTAQDHLAKQGMWYLIGKKETE